MLPPLFSPPQQDPMEVVHKYGADALRLYLINSPVVRARACARVGWGMGPAPGGACCATSMAARGGCGGGCAEWRAPARTPAACLHALPLFNNQSYQPIQTTDLSLTT